MSESSGERDSSCSVASPDTAVTSTSTGKSGTKHTTATGLPKLGSSPTPSGGEGEVSSTSTSGEETNPWNFTEHIDDALAGVRLYLL